MTKEKILETIKQAETENGNEFDLTYDEQTDRLFDYLTQSLDLELSVELRESITDSWLQCEYYSQNLGKAIIWQYDVGNFDDYEEVADFIIRTEQKIKEFEARLPKLR